MFIYHAVSNEVGTVLGVYGEALLSEAQEKARNIQASTGEKTYLHSVAVADYHARPRVGQSISMLGFHRDGNKFLISLQ